MGSNYICFLVCILYPFFALTVNAEKRTMSCDTICKGIRFPGKLGGCNCNYVIFTKRSSQLNKMMETKEENIEQLRHKIFENVDSVESAEYESQDERAEESQSESARNLINIIRRRIFRPIMRDLDY
ncbi:hypothetical protein X975_25488, partial [Stegodyphus mimosarum]